MVSFILPSSSSLKWFRVLYLQDSFHIFIRLLHNKNCGHLFCSELWPFVLYHYRLPFKVLSNSNGFHKMSDSNRSAFHKQNYSNLSIAQLSCVRVFASKLQRTIWRPWQCYSCLRARFSKYWIWSANFHSTYIFYSKNVFKYQVVLDPMLKHAHWWLLILRYMSSSGMTAYNVIPAYRS